MIPKTGIHFFNNYEIISSTKDYPALYSATFPIKCRFCGRQEPDTTFKQKAHAVPELLGANDYIIIDECDECNQEFSQYESDLSTFVAPYLVLLGIKGKKKIPGFQSRSINRDENTRTRFVFGEGNKRKLFINDIDDFRIDLSKKEFEINFRKSAFRKIYVYRALVKIGLSFLPQERISFYQDIFDWLMNRTAPLEAISNLYSTTLTYKYNKNPIVMLYEAKNARQDWNQLPELTLIVAFANVYFQIFLPFTWKYNFGRRGLGPPEAIIFPAFINEDYTRKNKFRINSTDLSSMELRSNNHSIKFKYQTADLNKSGNGIISI